MNAPVIATPRRILFLAILLCAPCLSRAQGVSEPPQIEGTPLTPEQAAEVPQERWAIHGQTTNVTLYQPGFHSPYQGPQSLSPAANARETFDAADLQENWDEIVLPGECCDDAAARLAIERLKGIAALRRATILLFHDPVAIQTTRLAPQAYF